MPVSHIIVTACVAKLMLKNPHSPKIEFPGKVLQVAMKERRSCVFTKDDFLSHASQVDFQQSCLA